ncbi:MAG: sigma 54-dependent Fis family transcriptional regulator [Deltaproteobacteria bacterium]|nr:sigma 54-dependent Fis family transcriptional regulator [Deltaproteobacteria bacterium]
MQTRITRVQGEGLASRLFRRRVEIRIERGIDAGKVVCSDEARLSVGSAEQNTLTIADPTISRFHLGVQVDPSGITVSDLDSTNGSFVGALQLGTVTTVDPISVRVADVLLRIGPVDEREVRVHQADRLGAMVGQSALMRELFAKVTKVAASNATVLIEGETGTGKELVAQEIHNQSARRDGPFVVVDCGAIPENLIGSELFGHRRGAFTGATQDRAGAFEEADGGTLFLDELGELDAAMQPQLLRVLESRQVKRIGDANYRPVDVRVVAATNRDLRREVNRNAFRADLYYRLAVIGLVVPPLRQRKEDIPLLVAELLQDSAERLHVDAPPMINEQTLARLQAHAWPGNVRELRNVVDRVLLGRQIEAVELSLESPVREGLPGADELAHLPFREAKARWVEQFDRSYLSALLERCKGNVAEAARQSGIARVHLFRLIKKYQLKAEK